MSEIAFHRRGKLREYIEIDGFTGWHGYTLEKRGLYPFCPGGFANAPCQYRDSSGYDKDSNENEKGSVTNDHQLHY
jgi:hypothetical protein